MKKYVIGFILGLLVSGGIVCAATLLDSKDVTYTPSDNTFDVGNVKLALDKLYDEINSVVTSRLYVQPEVNNYALGRSIFTVANYKKIKILYSQKYIQNATWYSHRIAVGSDIIVDGIRTEDLEIDLSSYNPDDQIVVQVWLKGTATSVGYGYLDYELYK